MSRIVVTGLGAVSPLGLNAQTFWDGLLAGRNAYREVTAFDLEGQRTRVGCEVQGLTPLSMRLGMEPRAGRGMQMALAASVEALGQAGFSREAGDSLVMGVCLGTTMGEIRILEEFLEAEAVESPRSDPESPSFKQYPCSSIPINVASHLHLKGPNLMIPAACAAGNYAIGMGYDLLQRGEADAMIVGGVDPYSRVAHSGFNRMMAVSPDVCRPFDANRRGIIPGEGAGILVIETESHARHRGAEPLAFIDGYGLSSDARHMTDPDPSGSGLARAIGLAFAMRGGPEKEIDYVSAHGTGTRANDLAETNAMKLYFGKRAFDIPISSVKSMIGHTMGAASALEAVASVMCLRTQHIPPTMNYQEPDPLCDLDYVPNACRGLRVRSVMSLSMAFGGNNSCLLLSEA